MFYPIVSRKSCNYHLPYVRHSQFANWISCRQIWKKKSFHFRNHDYFLDGTCLNFIIPSMHWVLIIRRNDRAVFNWSWLQWIRELLNFFSAFSCKKESYRNCIWIDGSIIKRNLICVSNFNWLNRTELVNSINRIQIFFYFLLFNWFYRGLTMCRA